MFYSKKIYEQVKDLQKEGNHLEALKVLICPHLPDDPNITTCNICGFEVDQEYDEDKTYAERAFEDASNYYESSRGV